MKMYKKFIATAMASSIVMGGATTFASTGEYNDVQNHWAKSAIERWSDLGVVLGFGGEFRPNDNITRGELAVILDRIMNYQVVAENTFLDLEDGKFYTDAVLKANQAGVIMGTSNTEISPLENVTREQACVMIARALGVSTEGNETTQFEDDSAISSWAKQAVCEMVCRLKSNLCKKVVMIMKRIRKLTAEWMS